MRSTQGLRIALTVALLAFGVTTMTMAMAGDPDKAKEMILTGQLSVDADEEYTLTDPDSGESVLLRGSEDKLAEHVGSSVAVTGSWAGDEEGNAFFKVTSVEPVNA